MPRCPVCASPLTFAGPSPTGESLYACTTTRYLYDRARTASFLCTPGDVFYRADGSAVRGDPFVKRDKRGNVLLPRAWEQGVLTEPPQTALARAYAAKLTQLDDLPKVTVRDRDGNLRTFIPPQLRLKARKTIEQWASSWYGERRRAA